MPRPPRLDDDNPVPDIDGPVLIDPPRHIRTNYPKPGIETRTYSMRPFAGVERRREEYYRMSDGAKLGETVVATEADVTRGTSMRNDGTRFLTVSVNGPEGNGHYEAEHGMSGRLLREHIEENTPDGVHRVVDTRYEDGERVREELHEIVDNGDGTASAATTIFDGRGNVISESGVLTVPLEVGPGSCFAAGTRVLLEDGGAVAIYAVRIGDRVLGFDESTGALRGATVTEVFRHAPRPCLNLIVEGLVGPLVVTKAHRFFVDGAWQQAATFALGTRVTSIDGARPEVILIGDAPPVPVFNLEVDDVHTYFAEGVLVHNLKIPDVPGA
jgi:Pretoxin HINT domain